MAGHHHRHGTRGGFQQRPPMDGRYHTRIPRPAGPRGHVPPRLSDEDQEMMMPVDSNQPKFSTAKTRNPLINGTSQATKSSQVAPAGGEVRPTQATVNGVELSDTDEFPPIPKLSNHPIARPDDHIQGQDAMDLDGFVMLGARVIDVHGGHHHQPSGQSPMPTGHQTDNFISRDGLEESHPKRQHVASGTAWYGGAMQETSTVEQRYTSRNDDQGDYPMLSPGQNPISKYIVPMKRAREASSYKPSQGGRHGTTKPGEPSNYNISTLSSAQKASFHAKPAQNNRPASRKPRTYSDRNIQPPVSAQKAPFPTKPAHDNHPASWKPQARSENHPRQQHTSAGHASLLESDAVHYTEDEVNLKKAWSTCIEYHLNKCAFNDLKQKGVLACDEEQFCELTKKYLPQLIKELCDSGMVSGLPPRR